MLTVGVVAVLQPDFTKACLQSIIESSVNELRQLQIIIVANGAKQEVLDVLDQYKKKHEQITVIKNVENKGYAYACNQILKQCYTEHVCFLHNDVVLSKRALELLVNEADSSPNSTICFIPMTNYANEHFPCIKSVREHYEAIKPPNKEFLTNERLQIVLNTLYGDLNQFALSLEGENKPTIVCDEISSFCCLFRTKSLLKIGGFENSFYKRGFEDKELWLRLREAELQIALCQNIFVHHHGNLTTDGEGFNYPQLMEEQGKIYQRFFEKKKLISQKKQVGVGEPVFDFSSNFRKVVSKSRRSEKKSLLYFGSHYPPENAGGAELSAHETHLKLANYGVGVTAFTIRDRFHECFKETKVIDHQGVEVLQIPEKSGEELRQQLTFLMEEYKPQVLLTHSTYAFHALKVASELFPSIKRIFSFRHQTDILDSRIATLLSNDGGTTIISNSRWMQRYLRQQCNRDSELILPVVTPKTCRLEECDLKRKTVTIGNGVLSKGIKELIQIARALPEIKFDVWGSLDPNIPRKMLPSNVETKGWTRDLKDIYKEARVVINLSVDPEPFGRTLIEAMYNRIPVIAHNEGGPKEIVSEGGILVSNTDEAIDAIVRIFEEPQVYEMLCQGTVNDLKRYNPFRENEKLIRVILESFGETLYEGLVF